MICKKEFGMEYIDVHQDEGIIFEVNIDDTCTTTTKSPPQPGTATTKTPELPGIATTKTPELPGTTTNKTPPEFTGNDGTVSTTTEPPPGFTGAEILITNEGEPVEDAKVTLICIDDLPEVFTAVEQSDGKYRFEDDISVPYDLECELIVEKDG